MGETPWASLGEAAGGLQWTRGCVGSPPALRKGMQGLLVKCWLRVELMCVQ